MNYYPHHIGDYLTATAHLSWLEDAAYRRLLDVYYSREAPIPGDLVKACRLVRAISKEERTAVQVVLEEFFTLADGAWMHGRCDAEIATYNEGSTERDAKEANEKERQKRHRERRADMFEALRAVGVVPAWDIAMKELQRLYDTTCNAPATVTGALQVVISNAPETPRPRLPITRTKTITRTNTGIPAFSQNSESVGIPPHSPVENFIEVIKTKRPDLDAELFLAKFCSHYAPEKQTEPRLVEWLATERKTDDGGGGVPSVSDPDSRASIEAKALARGMQRFEESLMQWPQYRAMALGRAVVERAA